MICYSVKWHSLKMMTQDQGRGTWDPVHRIQDPGAGTQDQCILVAGVSWKEAFLTCHWSNQHSIQLLTPLNLSAKFQRPKYPDPQSITFLTAISSFCPPNTSTCFDCRRSLREGKDLDFIAKSRRPIGRDDTGIRQCTTDLENVCFHLSEDCVRSVFPNFVPLYIKFIDNYCHRNKATPCCN